MVLSSESFFADIASKWSFISMSSSVNLKIISFCELPFTVFTDVILLLSSSSGGRLGSSFGATSGDQEPWRLSGGVGGTRKELSKVPWGDEAGKVQGEDWEGYLSRGGSLQLLLLLARAFWCGGLCGGWRGGLGFVVIFFDRSDWWKVKLLGSRGFWGCLLGFLLRCHCS